MRIANLQSVVVGMIAVREPVNHREEWEPGIVWPSCLLAMTTGNLSRGIRVHLVDVRDTIELGPMIADVTNVQRAGAEYLLLQVKAPRGDIGGAQVRINSEDTTGVALQSGVVAVKTGPATLQFRVEKSFDAATIFPPPGVTPAAPVGMTPMPEVEALSTPF